MATIKDQAIELESKVVGEVKANVKAAVDAVKSEVSSIEAAVVKEVEVVKVWLTTRLGFPLHNHAQDRTAKPGEAVLMDHDQWVKDQLAAQLVTIVDAPLAGPAPKVVATPVVEVSPFASLPVGGGPATDAAATTDKPAA